jgi:hypothetical protein
MPAAKATIDHDTIRTWVEGHGGQPAAVRGTGSGDDPGILRIDFPDYGDDENLEEISWDAFFGAFEDNELAFLYQEKKDSRFNKLVSRDNVKLDDAAKSSSSKSAGSGKKKSSKAPKGPHAIQLLERQHREVEALFAQHDEAEDQDEKQEAFEKLADALAAHAKIEEEIFYPSMLTDATEDELREAVEEHLAAKRMMADLLEMTPDDPQWEAKVSVLREAIEHHVEEEEDELFEMLEDVSDAEMRTLGAKMKKMYDEVIGTEPRTNIPSETESAAPL